MLAFQFATLDGRHIADSADQMFVHRVVMIHVELHQPDDAAEFRNETTEDTGFIQPAQCALGIAPR